MTVNLTTISILSSLSFSTRVIMREGLGARAVTGFGGLRRHYG
jgi:hypothetical protein